MGSGEMLQEPDGDTLERAGSSEARVTSKHRGLYYDRKHGSWRVRIFYLGRQRHIGRYKDETQAAQAYDRAAYFLYGTRANLNFRLKDVLADTQDVPASIRQAKEQSMPAHLPRHTPATASSSSSTNSCSPHHSAQSLHCMTHSAAGMVRVGSGQSQFTATGSVLHHPVLQHQQHQQQQYYAACGFQQQQQLLPQPQMLLPGPGNASPSYSSSTAWMPTEQQMQPRAYGQPAAAAAAVRYDPAWQQQQHQHQQQSLVALQQQQLAALQQQQPGVYVPDVVASVIAALGLPSQASSQAASSSSSSSSTWAGSNATALAPPAGTAAAVIGGPGGAVLAAAGAADSSPACLPFSGPLPLNTSHVSTALLPAEYASQLQAVVHPDGLTHGGSGLGGIHWSVSSSHAGQMGSHGALGAMQQQQHRLAPAAYSAMPQASLPVAAVPPQGMPHLMAPNHHHHHYQQQQQQMQLQMQFQTQQGHGMAHGRPVLLNLPAAQQVPASVTQPGPAGGLLASMSSVEGPGGAVLAGNQLSAPSNMAWQQQQLVLSMPVL